MIVDVKVLETSNPTSFENQLKELISTGYELKSSSVGFVNSEKYDFCGSYQALLVKIFNKNFSLSPKYIIGTKVKLLEPTIAHGSRGVIIGYQSEKKSDQCLYVVKYRCILDGEEYTFCFDESLILPE